MRQLFRGQPQRKDRVLGSQEHRARFLRLDAPAQNLVEVEFCDTEIIDAEVLHLMLLLETRLNEILDSPPINNRSIFG